MTQILESARIPAPIPVPESDAPSQRAPDRSEAVAREIERARGYRAGVEATYWYMLVMLLLGLYAAFWIVVMAQNSP